MAPTTDLDVLRLVAADPHGMVGEELLHEFGFEGTDAAIASAMSQGWLASDADGIYCVTNTGLRALASNR